MNYFAQGIQQGGEIGARSYLEKQKRDQDAALNKARLDFEASQLKENFKGQGALLDTRLLADAENARLSREFTGGENALNRTYGTSERLANQGFQGGQNDANRALTASQGQATRNVTTSEGAANRAQNEKEAAARLFLDAQRLKQGGEQFDATRAWAESAENPQNKRNLANADYLMRSGDQPLISASQTRQSAKLSSADQQALTYAQANPNDPRSAAIMKRLGMAQ